MSAPLATAAPAGRLVRLPLRDVVPLVSADAPVRWVHVAYEGTWKGHPSGPFTLDKAVFSQCVANFDAQANPVPLDFEHASEISLEAPACGWVHDLKVRADEAGRVALYAQVEFGEKASRYLADGAYRFSSAVFDFDAVDRRTNEPIGCRLRSLALTNQPFIDGQEPIVLSERAARALAEGGPMEVNVEELIAQLQAMEGDAISPEAIAMIGEGLALLQAAKGGDVAEAEPAAEEVPAEDMPENDPPAPMADADDPERSMPPVAATDVPQLNEGDAAAMFFSSLSQALGVDQAAALAMAQENMDGVVAALQGTLDAAPAAEAPLSDVQRELDDARMLLSAKGDLLERTQVRVNELTEELKSYREGEADRAVQGLIESGRLLDDKAPEWRELFLSDRNRFTALSEGLSQVVPVDGHATAVAEAQADEAAEAVNLDEHGRLVRNLRAARLTDKQIAEVIEKQRRARA